MSKPDEILEFSPQELSLLEHILQREVEQHPETADSVQPLLDKVTAHFSTAWPYDYKLSQEQSEFFKQAFKILDGKKNKS